MAVKRRLQILGIFTSVITALLLTLIVTSRPAFAANPTTISFQGKVVNSNGTNVTNGNYGFVFRLYTTSSGGSAIWTESDTLTVTGGVFQVNLGANCSFFVANACNNNTPIDFNATSGLYLGVTFNSDPAGEMSPRVQMQSVPFAFNADKVGGLGANQLVQLSPASQQSGAINVSGNVTSAATIQGGTLNGTTGINTGAAGGTQRIDNSGNLLNIGTITGSSALAVVSGGTAQNLTINASTTGTVQIAGTSTGNVELGGGVLSGSGCTLTNSNGDFACNGVLSSATSASVGSTTTAGSISFKDGTVSGNTATITAPVIVAPYSLTLPTTGPATSQCLRTDSVVASQLVFGTCANIGQKLTQTFSAYGVNQAANATTAMNFMLPTTATAVSFALAGTTEFRAASAGSFRACTIVSSAAVTAGSVSVRFRKNGANVSATNHCTLSTTNTRTNSEEIATGTETFAAGDTIGVALVSTGLTPATLENWVTFTVEYGAGGVGPTSMQDAYDNGSTVTTADNKNVTFNLSNTATDSNFLVNVATGSTGRFGVQNNGVDVLSIGGAGNLVVSGTINTATISGGTLSASAVNGLNVSGTAISGSGTGLAIAAGGTAQNLTLDGATLGKVVIGSVSTGDIDLGGGSASTGCTVTNATGEFVCSSTINGAAITATTFNTANISGGSLSSTAVNGLNTSASALSSSAAATFTIDANGTQQVSIAGTSTGDILIGGGVGSTGCTITNVTGALSCSSTVNGATISSTAFNGATISGGSLSTTAVNSLNVSSSAIAATAAAPFTIDANAAQNISIGATSTGDILIGGGSASTGCTVTNSNGNLTCSGTMQGATISSLGAVNAVTQLQINGANINTAGTLTNVAYLNQANAFTAANSFTATGTALSVTNNASVGGTLTAGTFSGSGASLTNLNASNLASGTVPNAAITGNYTGITGTGALAAGSIASGFGSIATTNSISTSAAVQGGTVTATGALSGGSLSINGGTFAVNAAGAITAATGATVTGSVTASTSVITPTLTTSGALTINSGAANNVTIDSAGAGTATVNIGTTNATAVGLSRTGQTTTVNGALAVNQSATFNQNVTMTFNGVENMSVITDLAGNVSAISVVATPSTTAGSTNGVLIQQANSANANGLDNGLTIDNANSTTAIGSALNITNSGGAGYTNLISSSQFTVTGSGEIRGAGFDYFDPSNNTSLSSLGSGGTAAGNFGGAFSSGAFIGNNDMYAQEFVASLANATTNNRNVGDSTNWYFTNNGQAQTSSSAISNQGGYFRITNGTTTGRGGLVAQGATPGTLDTPIQASNLPIIQVKVRPSIVRTRDDFVWGAFDRATAVTTNDTLPNNGLFFWTNNSTGATGWQGVVRSGGATIGTVNCSGGITTNFATGRIIVVNNTTVRFFIDVDATDGINFVDCGTVNGTVPAAGLALGMYDAHTTNTASTFDMDYARFWQDDTTQSVAAATAINDPNSQANTNTIESSQNLASNADVSDAPDRLITVGGQTIALVGNDGSTSFVGALQSDSIAVLKGLTVGGDATFAGLTTFQKLATFLAKTVFRQNVEFNAHVAVASDSAGYVTFKAGEQKVHVSFKDSYDQLPVIALTNTGGQFATASVDKVTVEGFDVVLASPVTTDTTLSWVAVGAIDPQTTTTSSP